MVYVVPGGRDPRHGRADTRPTRLVHAHLGLQYTPGQVIDRPERRIVSRAGILLWSTAGCVIIAADYKSTVENSPGLNREDPRRSTGRPPEHDVGPGHVSMTAHGHADELRERVYLGRDVQETGGVHVLATGHRQPHPKRRRRTWPVSSGQRDRDRGGGSPTRRAPSTGSTFIRARMVVASWARTTPLMSAALADGVADINGYYLVPAG